VTTHFRVTPIGLPGANNVDEQETAERPLVLVIDDDEGIREGIVDLLEESGLAAVGACNGLEALNFLAESPRKPALILLDLMMPILDGWTFCKVRQGVAMLMDIPVVAISAAPMNGKHEPLRVEATLAKPFDPDALAWLATRMANRKKLVPPRH
jgi:CheY-like chemotaxis protein